MARTGICLNPDCVTWTEELLASAGSCPRCGHLAPCLPGPIWALDLNAGPVSAQVVLQTAHGFPPAVHTLAARRQPWPAGALNELGWQPVGGWLPRSWGALATVEPG